MEIIILDTEEAVYREASEQVLSLVHKKPDAVLGLATGRTMVGVYRHLVEAYTQGRVDFANVTTFNLDEYLGVDPEDPLSFRSYMETHFFKKVNLAKKNIFLPESLPEDVEEACRAYEQKIQEKGGMDLQILGIGRDGHIGFNEPSSSLMARTRIKTLTDETLLDNFGTTVGPRFAITMGIGTIMEARKIILVAVGREKAKAVAQAVEGPVSASCPASALQLHPVVKVILEKEAAGLLERRDYYEWVWRHKREAEKPHLLYPGKKKSPGR